jgi:hypothetical protein
MVSGKREASPRQARRPASQSSQLIGSFIGIGDMPDLERFGLFMD